MFVPRANLKLLILIFHNEYGHKSIIRLYGVEFITEGQVHSINDLYTENTMQYVARDIDTMISYDKMSEFKDMMFERQGKGQFIDNQMGSMLELKRKLENQIADTDNIIFKLEQEAGKRSVAGIMTLGLANLADWGINKITGQETVTRQDIDREKSQQLTIKQSLLEDLNRVNKQISQYEQNIIGWNAQNSQDGTASYDYLSHGTVN
jgi:hypothetical protein